jgi:hypothetical protein
MSRIEHHHVVVTFKGGSEMPLDPVMLGETIPSPAPDSPLRIRTMPPWGGGLRRSHQLGK